MAEDIFDLLTACRARTQEKDEGEFPSDEFELAQRFEYLCIVGHRGYEGGVKVA